MIKLIISICLCTSLISGSPIPRDGDYRLPRTIIPSKYNIGLTIDDDKLEKFTGTVNIEAEAKESDIKTIILHVKGLTIKQEDVKVTGRTVKTIDFDSNKDFIIFNLDTPFTKNDKVILNIKYEGQIRNDMYGLYKSEYAKDKYILATQMEPTYARAVFPCFDEPDMKATFNMTVTVPEKFTHVISNMAENKTNPVTPPVKMKIYKFLETNKMSTYLIALMVATDDFIFKSGQDQTLKIWARKNAEKQLEFAAKYSEIFLETMGNKMQLKYKDPPMNMNKMDMAAIPDFAAGAMENWGLLTYRESALLYDPKHSTIKDRQRVASVIAHEQAHQWFGDLVTLKWWNNTWLNEGFATYFEYHTLVMAGGNELCGKVKGDDCWEMKKQFVVEEHQTALAADSVSSSAPLTKQVNTLEEIQSHFDAISYNKGGSIIRMMEHIVGSDVYFKGLNSYLSNKAHINGNTVPENLFSSFKVDQSRLPQGKSLNDVMNNWITRSGYPIVNVTLNDKKITFTQEKFKLDKEDKKDDEWWYIPISYGKNKDDLNKDDKTTPKLWLDKENKTIEFDNEKDAFIVLNVESTGYYRVNYELSLLQKISNALSTDINSIPEINRAQLVDDVLNLARISKISYQDAFSNLLFLTNETSYYTWSSAYSAYRFLLQRFPEDSFEGKELRKNLLVMMKGKVYNEKNIESIFKDNDTESVIETYNRVNALQWACDLGDQNCLDKTKNIYKEMNHKPEEIPINTKGIIYCSALRSNESAFYDILKRFNDSNVAAEKELFIKALGCNEKKTRALLESSVNGTFRTQDTQYAFQSAYTGTPEGVNVVLDFVTEKKAKDEKDTYPNWEKMKTKYGGMNGINKAIIGLSDRLTKEDQVKKLTDFLEAVGKEDNNIKNIKESVVKTMKANLAWQAENKDALKNFFCSTYSDSTKPDSCKDDGGAASSISASCLAITIGVFAAYLGRF